ncbi:hypothetical protein F5Y12DRAFT_223374 [Xylaria sp. FL1777]|nr:hypothetical protein F5Y12DRAFT_223374 [Xylaria sp. FL1777]
MASSDPPIFRLGPDLLWDLFSVLAQDRNSNAWLLSCMLCCKKWRPFASSVLYEHVVLDSQRLAKFVNNHADCEVKSLTVRMDAVGVNPYDPTEAFETTIARIASLRKLGSLIKEMKPATVSISVDIPFPATATPEIASIIDGLSASCTSLEINVRHSGSFMAHPAKVAALSTRRVHLCDSIHAVLPRLQHLRLRLPVLCPAIFADPDSQDPHRQAIRTPLLKTCLINLSLRPPTYPNQGSWATMCSDDCTGIPHIGQAERVPSALPPMEQVLRDFAHVNRSNLERLWIMDAEPLDREHPNAYAGWIRRDFLSDASYPIPIWNVGVFNRGARAARVPSLTSPGETQDWLGSSEQVEAVSEGGTWGETSTGARLPTQNLQKYRPGGTVMTRAEFQKGNAMNTMLWKNEDTAGQAMLPRGPGECMQRWVLHEITPSGWRRVDDGPGAPLVRA